MEKKEDKKKAKPQVWTKEQENLLAEWSEKASAYRWLHSRSEKRYRCRNLFFYNSCYYIINFDRNC